MCVNGGSWDSGCISPVPGPLMRVEETCPAGHYPSVVETLDGSASAPFCSNAIVSCAAGGWSLGLPTVCPGLYPPGSRTPLPDYPVTYVDGGFCCDLAYEYAEIAAAEEAGADVSASDAADAAGE